MTPQVAIEDSFLDAYTRIPRSRQKKVLEFLKKFRHDPTQSSINYERLNTAKDDKVRTVRIGKDYRAVILHPPRGDVYILVWVDHHDEAIDWTRNRRFDVHPETGSLQSYVLVSAEEVAETAVPEREEPVQPAVEPPAPVEEGLFDTHDDASLQRCGLPAPLLPAVRSVHTEQQFDALAPLLPSEAADALFLLAAGGTVEEALAEVARARDAKKVDTDDFATAIERSGSKRHYAVIDSERELLEMLEAPLERWRVFLHPTQRSLARMRANGPVRVLGGAGTGKTVVAMHRARHLAAEVFTGADDRILFTTFTRNLARDIENQLDTLCGEERRRIDVVHLHILAVRYLRDRGKSFSIANDKAQRSIWKQAFEEANETELPLSFFRDEWEHVVQPESIGERAAYLKVRRVGRGTRLTRAQRGRIWKVFARYRELLDERGLVEWMDVVRAAIEEIERTGERPYRAVVADEVQDFSALGLRLIRALSPKGRNDVFVVGDAHQRIYRHKASLGSCGIDIRGRGRRLKVNYRTTDRIRRWAVALLDGVPVDDLDGGDDNLRGYRSLRRGVVPVVTHFATPNDEEQRLIEQLRAWLKDGKAEEICIAARTNRTLTDRYRAMLERNGIAAIVVDPDGEAEHGKGVRLATMHRIKGLEFPRLVIASVQAGLVPLRMSDASFADDAAREEHEWQERRLLFVAATRARDELVVTGYGRPSPFVNPIPA